MFVCYENRQPTCGKVQCIAVGKPRESDQKIYAAFTLNGCDDQERNLIFVKTDFQVLKLKFHTCNFKQAF